MPLASNQNGPSERYHRLGAYFRTVFGGPVRKVSVDAGRGCPNRDGTLSHGGCLFCDPASFSPSRRAERLPIAHQVARAIERLRRRRRPKPGAAERFIAYFQPGTNTHGPPDELAADFRAALSVEGVVGLSVGTRPDCLPDETLDLLAELAASQWVTVELGLQSTHDATLEWLRRGHDFASFADAVKRCQHRGLRTTAHLILGLPGEGPDEVRTTADRLTQLAIDGVKLHNLHVVRQTPLADLYEQGAVRIVDLPEYAGLVVDLLERLPWRVVVERLAGDAPPDYLLAPDWCLDRQGVRQAILREFEQRRSWQGQLANETSGTP